MKSAHEVAPEWREASVSRIAELRADLQHLADQLALLGYSEELLAVNEAYVRLGRRYPKS